MPRSLLLAKISKLAIRASIAFFLLAIASFIFHIAPDLSWDRNPFGPDSQIASDEYWIILPATSWAILGTLATIVGIASRFYSPILRRAEDDEARRKTEADRAARQAIQDGVNYQNLQRQLENSAVEANRLALYYLDSLPGHLSSAAESLAQAETDWDEHVYNPFWTSIEYCAVHLSNFSSAVQSINSASERYRNAALSYDGQLAPFSVTMISVDAMNAQRTIYERMKKMTRRAQGDVNFASIFEMWRGNKIAEKGFASLQSAITQMSSDISDQISSLRSSVEHVAKSVESQTDRVTSAVEHQTSVASMNHSELNRTLNESRRHEKIIADRLWRIEHGNNLLF